MITCLPNFLINLSHLTSTFKLVIYVDVKEHSLQLTTYIHPPNTDLYLCIIQHHTTFWFLYDVFELECHTCVGLLPCLGIYI